jgi:nuclear transport factor 2 (NTF2) superfamily protein
MQPSPMERHSRLVNQASHRHNDVRGYNAWRENYYYCLEPRMLRRGVEFPMNDVKTSTATRPPAPPFTPESAVQKVRLAEDGWNSRDPDKVALSYTPDSRWRNRAEFVNGRAEIIAFLKRKWAKELEYRLIKELWAFDRNRIAVRFAYEWHDDSANWFRSYGNENWEFDENGLMRARHASINDLPIKESERKYDWPLGRRPDEHPGLSDLGF